LGSSIKNYPALAGNAVNNSISKPNLPQRCTP
jgi:hypothetical protein